MHGQAYLPSSIHLKTPQIPPDYKHIYQKITIKQTFIHLPNLVSQGIMKRLNLHQITAYFVKIWLKKKRKKSKEWNALYWIKLFVKNFT